MVDPEEPKTAHTAEEQFRSAQDGLLLRYGSSAVSRYVTIDGPAAEVHLLDAGNGEPVILLHEAGAFAVGWLPLLAALEGRFRVIAPDLPGCGLSARMNYKGHDFRNLVVSYLLSLLDTLKLEKASFVGNGVGGYYSLAFALDYPRRVNKMALVGAPAGIGRESARLLQLLGTPIINNLILSTALAPTPAQTREIYGRMWVANIESVPNDYLHCAYLARCLPGADASWRSMMEELFTLRGFRVRYLLADELRLIPHPILLAWGERDWFAPLSAAKRACGLLPNCELRVIHDTGHLVWIDQAEASAQMLLDFL